jgi:ATP adenylyltransferase
MHILPRWFSDTNFMTVTGETRVLPEDLPMTWEKLSRADWTVGPLGDRQD